MLPQSEIQKVLDELKIKYRQRLFYPFVTLWAFLSQVLEPDKSCHNAVSRVISYLVGEKVELPSTDSSAYCQARGRLPQELLQKLFGKAAQSLEEKVTSESEFITLPSTLIVQEIYFYIIIPGFRTERVSLITTLLDTTIYSSLEVLKLYGGMARLLSTNDLFSIVLCILKKWRA